MIAVNRKSVKRKDLAYFLIMSKLHGKQSDYHCLDTKTTAYYPLDTNKQRPYNLDTEARNV